MIAVGDAVLWGFWCTIEVSVDDIDEPPLDFNLVNDPSTYILLALSRILSISSRSLFLVFNIYLFLFYITFYVLSKAKSMKKLYLDSILAAYCVHLETIFLFPDLIANLFSNFEFLLSFFYFIISFSSFILRCSSIFAAIL